MCRSILVDLSRACFFGRRPLADLVYLVKSKCPSPCHLRYPVYPIYQVHPLHIVHEMSSVAQLVHFSIVNVVLKVFGKFLELSGRWLEAELYRVVSSARALL